MLGDALNRLEIATPSERVSKPRMPWNQLRRAASVTPLRG